MKGVWHKYINRKVIMGCFIFMGLFLLLCTVGVSDETKDDFGLQMYISGQDGTATYYHQWASAFRIVSTFALQRMFPVFAWNFLLQTIFIFIAILIISQEIINRLSGVPGEALALFLSGILFFQSISVFNFTRTAALVICAGLCLLMHERLFIKWVGGILFICAVALRISIICIPVGFVTICFLWQLYQVKDDLKNGIKQVLRKFVLPMTIVFAVALLVEGIGQLCMSLQPEWRKIYNRCLLSGEVMDFGLEEYDSDFYQSLSFSENDFAMIKTRMSNCDSGYYTDDLYDSIIAHSSKKWNVQLSDEVFRSWKELLTNYLKKTCFGWMIWGLLLAAFVLFKREYKWLPVLIGLCLAAYLIMFCVMGRVVDRVAFSVYLCAGTGLLLCIDKDINVKHIKTVQEKRKKYVLQYVVYIGIILCLAGMSVKYRREVRADIAEVFDYMEENKENFYLYTNLSQHRAVDNMLFSKDYWNTWNSMYASDYDIAQNTLSKYERYGITNIWKDAVDSDTVRIIDNSNIEIIEKYIAEHYCKSARAIKIDEISEYNVYKIVS